ncbi:MAG: hypothetical protein CMN00_06060 [Rickettsiales bacterium]|nr:hypothetical protein [Rickettsiales bacterium]
MVEKRNIEEIVESIFKLVTEAKNTNLQIANKAFETKKLINNVPKDKKTENINFEINKKKSKESDWSKIKFQPRKEIHKKFNTIEIIKKTLNSKLEHSLKLELKKFIEKELKKIVESEIKKHSEKLIKEKIKKA